ncbi:MAG TPA: sodium:alanine symporter family protein, partial [Thermoanaerobaculia bacterium]|nr:sodium:alanine symporter family protein [Thermoanaerobaculia bacterium]
MEQSSPGWIDKAQEWVGTLSGWVWGWPLLILLVGTGFYLTFLLRGLQFRELKHSLWLALVKRKEEGEGDISHFQALMTALAATVGTGNIAGVAGAIAIGGPGALFWMWMTGLVGMATKYAEAVLGVKYRVVDPRGEMAGGPMYYLSRGVGGTLGKSLGWIFALFAAIAAFGIGNMVQSNSVGDALRSSFGVPPIWTGVVIAVLSALVILGGIKSIGRFTGFFVPVMIVFYIVGALVVLAINWRGLPAIFVYVIQDAFRPAAAVGGFAGATLMAAVRMGVARGVFSNESGLGTGGIAAAAAQTQEPVTQALVSMTQTFIDTIVVCSLTGFTIIASGAWMRVDPLTGVGFTGAPLTIEAFSTGLPGTWGGYIVSIGLALFAFSTILGWSYYGERAVDYLVGAWAILPYRILFIVASFVGAWVVTLPEATGFQLVWTFADVMNGAMAFPNLVGLLLLSGVVARETREYFARRD